MKTFVFFIMLYLFVAVLPSYSQISINNEGSPPDPSAILDINSINKGVLIPRLTSPQILSISSPSAGLMVYNTTLNLPLFFNGTKWCRMDGTVPMSIGMVYGGGIIFYVDETGEHGLVSAIEDQSSGTTWGCFGTTIPGVSNTSIGTGITNTKKIVVGCPEDDIAAKICANLSLNGFDDWFLPAYDELVEQYKQREIIGGFEQENYWSSSQWDSQRSYVFEFSVGSYHVYYKNLTYPNVRCIRNTNQAPSLPSNPNPEDGSTNPYLGITTLSWSCSDPEGDPVTYDVYFDVLPNPLNIVASGITAESFILTDTLDRLTTYYWKIVAMDNHTNNITEGNIWQFTTSSWMCGDTLFYSGEAYPTIQIGNQCWMAENLDVGIQIDSLTTPADNSYIEKLCYRDSIANCDIYGGLYNWFEMMQYIETEGTQGICATGWHIPSSADWNSLVTYMGGTGIAGGALKEEGTVHWKAPNTGATNSSGFTALPGGYKNSHYSNRSIDARFLTSSSATSYWYWGWSCYYGNSEANYGWQPKEYSFSVRCLKD